jgi:hypothetical protein
MHTMAEGDATAAMSKNSVEQRLPMRMTEEGEGVT